MEKIWNNLTAGLKKYCHDNGFSDVILGLSGGMDSALVSVIAADALGKDHVHTLMMKTKYTSQESLDIAQELADLNGYAYKVIDIQAVIDNQKEFLKSVFEAEPKNIVLENLQARERGKTLMACSNQFGYLVLACGNKSEAAMGYCTLYGDICGGISPIGNLYKTAVFELARWRNTKGYVIPEAVINRAPSAELSADQKDEDSLPPYSILDAILAEYIDKGKSRDEIVKQGYDAERVDWIIKQYNKMAFKREQAPKPLSID